MSVSGNNPIHNVSTNQEQNFIQKNIGIAAKHAFSKMKEGSKSVAGKVSYGVQHVAGPILAKIGSHKNSSQEDALNKMKPEDRALFIRAQEQFYGPRTGKSDIQWDRTIQKFTKLEQERPLKSMDEFTTETYQRLDSIASRHNDLDTKMEAKLQYVNERIASLEERIGVGEVEIRRDTDRNAALDVAHNVRGLPESRHELAALKAILKSDF